MNLERVNKYATINGFIWFVISINPFFIWIFPRSLVYLFSTIIVFISTLFLFKIGNVVVYKSRLLSILSVFIFSVFLLIIKGLYVNALLSFLPFTLILLWEKSIIINIYELIKKFIIFFAVGSSIISLLSIFDLQNFIPYFDLPAQSDIQERHNTINRVYLLFSTNYNGLDIILRACGPLQEPGHFSIFLGLLYFTETLLSRKRNLWIILCGILTFSSNFVIMFVLSEIYRLYSERKISILISIIAFISLLLTVFMLLPSNLKDEIIYLAFGRNLEIVINALSSGGIIDALSERTNASGELVYENFMRSPQYFLTGYPDNFANGDTVLSDFRSLIVRYGFIGFSMVIFLVFSFSNYGKKFPQLLILSFMLLILLHRAWMMSNTYIYFLSFAGMTIYKQNQFEIKYLASNRV